MFITSLQECDFGSTYQQSISLFNGMIVGIGMQGLIQFTDARWDEGIFKDIPDD